MITPVWALTIDKLCERKDDLLVSADDINELAKNCKNKAIDEFVKAIKEHTTIVGTTYMCDIVLIAERLKGGAK